MLVISAQDMSDLLEVMFGTEVSCLGDLFGLSNALVVAFSLLQSRHTFIPNAYSLVKKLGIYQV